MRKLKITFNAPVTLGFVFICFVVTLLGVLTGGGSTRLLFMTYHSSLTNPLTYLRFFTHVFGHAGWSHFIGNASYLLLLGPMLEEKYGSKEMLEVIGVTALATGIVNYIFFWNVALCGASGVVLHLSCWRPLPDSEQAKFRYPLFWLRSSLSDSRYMKVSQYRTISRIWHISLAVLWVQLSDII